MWNAKRNAFQLIRSEYSVYLTTRYYAETEFGWMGRPSIGRAYIKFKVFDDGRNGLIKAINYGRAHALKYIVEIYNPNDAYLRVKTVYG